MTAADPVLTEAAARYGLAPEELFPLPGGHVARVLGFTRSGCDYVLRISPPDPEINLVSTRAVLAFLQYLAKGTPEKPGGAAVPRPVSSSAGRLVESIPDPEQPGGLPYLATAFVRAEGALAEELPVEQWDGALIEGIGRAVGRFHALSREYVPADPALDRPGWEEVGSCFNPLSQLAQAADPASPHHWVLAKRETILAAVRRLPRTPDCYAIVHSDLHFGNFYFDFARRSVSMFDFDDCAYGWLVMDIAMNLLDALVLYRQPDRAAFAERFLRHYLRGYREENTLSDGWIARMPLFLKLLEIGLYLQVAELYDPADQESWVGRFMAGRKANIEGDAPFVGGKWSIVD